MTRTLLIRTLVSAAVARSGMSACAQNAASPPQRLAAIKRDFPCRQLSFDYRILGRDSSQRALSPYACSLVLYAFNQIKRGNNGGIGIAPADTSKTVFASVSDVSILGLSQTGARLPNLDEQYWSIALMLRDTEQSVEVHVDQRTGRARILRAERIDTTAGR